MPGDWATSILIPVLKKGDSSVCENYRGISLIDAIAKVFAVLLLNRFSAERHARTRPNQGGFRPGRGCVDQIFTLRRILEHRYKFQQATITCFIDFRAAFDSVNRDALWKVLLLDGMPPKLVKLISSYYTATNSRVRVYGEESKEFALYSGVRQGCPLSPVLFNFAVDWIMFNALGEYRGVQVSPDLWISDLEYADDAVVLGDNPEDLGTVLNRIRFYAAVIGLQINTSKTKTFSFGLSSPDITVDNTILQAVPLFKYLRSLILPSGQAHDEIRMRIDHARSAFFRLKKALWNRVEVSLKTKVRVYKAVVRSVLLYGCETWPLRCEDTRKLEVFDHWCLRIISKVRWSEGISNEAIRRRCDIPRLSALIIQRRLQWFGHVLRKPADQLTKKVLHLKPCSGWRCRKGGQLKTWLSTVKSDVERLGLCAVYGSRRWKTDWLEICGELASDRRAWAGSIRDILGAGSSS